MSLISAPYSGKHLRLRYTYGRTMTYSDMPLIIPILAMAYVMTVYLLLSFAQKNSRPSQGQSQKVPEVSAARELA